MASEEHPFSMKFDMKMIDQLGLRLYQTLPPVISELVSNAWDADANVVNITIPTSVINHQSKIVVSDDGMGMDKNELNEKYLSIGRCRRENNPLERTPHGRPVMGRKGIGKLSVFGVADGVSVESKKDKKKNSFTMSLMDIRNTNGHEYYPKADEVEIAGEYTPGTSIILKNLSRTKKINIEEIRKQLSKRFSILSSEFQIHVNGKPIQPYLETIKNSIEEQQNIDEYLDEEKTMHIHGWIVTVKKPSDDAGIIIMAHGKMIQEPFFFFEPMGRHHGYSYMVGVINADFLDEQEEDLIATDRRSIAWDSDGKADILIDWGLKKILSIQSNWSKERTNKKRKQLFSNDKIEQWYNSRGETEKKLVDKLIETIVESQVHDDKIEGLVEAISERFDHELYNELVERFRETPPEDFNKILDLVNEWAFIEARDTLKVVKGRLGMIKTLEKYTKTDAYEKTIQEHLYKYPWLIHPTFISWEKEATLTTLLKNSFPEDKKADGKKRVDIVCLGTGSDYYIIELKRSSHKLDFDDLTQLKEYMSRIKEHLLSTVVAGGGIYPQQRVFGYLIGGSISDNPMMREELQRLNNQDISVKTYVQMIDIAKKMHKDFIDDLENSINESVDSGLVPLGKKAVSGTLKDFKDEKL